MLVLSPHVNIGVCIEHGGSLVLVVDRASQGVLDVAQISCRPPKSLVFITGVAKLD